MSETTRHHLNYSRTDWESSPNARLIRCNPLLIVRMDEEVHHAMHDECPPVPLLDIYTLRYVANNLRPSKDVLSTLDKECLLIEQAGKNKRSHEIQRKLGELTIAALQIQKPWVKQGMIKGV